MYEYAVTDDKDDHMAEVYVAHEPSSYQRATQDDESDAWQEAMIEEIVALHDHDIWTLVDPRSVKQRLLDCKLVFKIKPETRATKEQQKARLVAKGFQQRKGSDFNETFAPVSKLSSIHLLLGHARCRNLGVHQLDVKNALRNGHIHEEIFKKQPEGLFYNRRSNHVCKLLCTLYGLKQAAKVFYDALSSTLNRIQLRPLRTDTSIFHGKMNESHVWVVAYVDNLLIFASDLETVEIVKRELCQTFLLKELGRASEFVGITLIYDNQWGTLHLNQKNSIMRI